MFKYNNKDIRTTPGVFIVNFQHYFTPCSCVSIVNFEHVNAGWFDAYQYAKDQLHRSFLS